MEEQGKYRQAIEAFTRAVELGSNSSLVYYNRAVAYQRIKQYQKAVSDLNQAIKIDDGWGERDIDAAYYNRGLAYLGLEKHQQAIESFTQAITIDSSDFRAYYNRGLVYEKIGNTSAAISDFEQAAKLAQQQGNEEAYRKIRATLEEVRY